MRVGFKTLGGGGRSSSSVAGGSRAFKLSAGSQPRVPNGLLAGRHPFSAELACRLCACSGLPRSLGTALRVGWV